VLKQAKASGGVADVGEQSAGSAAGVHQIWDVDKLQRYILFVKENYQPVLSSDAMVILESYYQVSSTGVMALEIISACPYVTCPVHRSFDSSNVRATSVM